MKRILYNQFQIEAAVNRIRGEIITHITSLPSEVTKNPPTLMCVLDGGFRFFSDIVSEIDFAIKCDFIKVSSYSKKEQTDLKIHKYPKYPIIGSNIILIDDILDSGNTLNYIIDELIHHQVGYLSCATLLYRKNSPQLPIKHFRGLEIADEWVAGYGLDDYDGTSRNLNYIYELDKK